MPELPEVETTLRGIAPFVEHKQITDVIVRIPALRWPIPGNLKTLLQGQTVRTVRRRAKYLLLDCDSGSLLIHLGMSGNLRILENRQLAGRHDHVDIVFHDGIILRYRDPRRFGAILWHAASEPVHPLLANIGPEPLDRTFTATQLMQKAQGKKITIKQFIMDQKTVAGVGNIYANEALFLAGIHPATPASMVGKTGYTNLVSAIKKTLRNAITAGGTTLQDYANPEGKPGYFRQQLYVYGKNGQPCPRCGTRLLSISQAQRTTVFCPACQAQ